ncbi:MAG: hypothetical protein QW468_04200 [Candidatus Bathyarchaeia archaeon]
MEEINSVYKRLMDKAKDLFVFQSAKYILDLDTETMMPPKAIGLRSQQLALLSLIEHKMSTDPEIGMLLESILHNPKYDDLDEIQKRNLYLIKKQYDEQTALPRGFGCRNC